jgi:membrane-bound metal-dependent hydrolase YbcI (DUF457 family)
VPFTPYHLGPGLFFKSLAPRHFSFAAFLATQVVIDVEPLVYVLRGQVPVHRIAHTVLFGSLIGLAVASLIYLVTLAIRHKSAWHLPGLTAEVTPLGLAVGGLVGGASHAILDALADADIRPLRPFTDANPFQGLVTLAAVHMICLALGVIGLLWLASRNRLWRGPA